MAGGEESEELSQLAEAQVVFDAVAIPLRPLIRASSCGRQEVIHGGGDCSRGC